MLRLSQRIHPRTVVRPARPRKGERCICAVLFRYVLFTFPLPYSHPFPPYPRRPSLPRWLVLTTHPIILTNTTYLGPYGCIGKQLALMELRTVASLLVSQFDIRLAEGEDGRKLLEKSRDAFTLRMEALEVIFEERGKEKE